jgi:hypothetical protein
MQQLQEIDTGAFANASENELKNVGTLVREEGLVS